MDFTMAVVGASIAIGAAVVNGIVARRIAREIERLGSVAAGLSSELQRSDRSFDLANRSREHADHSLVFLHMLPEGKRWTLAALVSSIEHALVDALVFGHSAATGTEPDADASREYRRQARGVVELERTMARGAPETGDGASKARETDAWAEFHTARERQIAEYWARRAQILRRQAELKGSGARLASRRERVGALAVSLQILGLLVVLTKDLLK